MSHGGLALSHSKKDSSFFDFPWAGKSQFELVGAESFLDSYSATLAMSLSSSDRDLFNSWEYNIHDQFFLSVR